MTFFKEKELTLAVSEKYRRLDGSDAVEFTAEEATFAGAFVEDAIRFEDVDHYPVEVRRHEQH